MFLQGAKLQLKLQMLPFTSQRDLSAVGPSFVCVIIVLSDLSSFALLKGCGFGSSTHGKRKEFPLFVFLLTIVCVIFTVLIVFMYSW